MIALVMCGGRGTRMKSGGEKLLLKHKKPVIEHVISAVANSGCFSGIVCATSSNAPRTSEFVKELGMKTIETEGRGYVEDLAKALEALSESVFVVSGDLALLDSEIVKIIVSKYEEDVQWTSILVSRKFLDSMGIKPEFFVSYNGQECAYTGISIVNPRKIKGMNMVKESFILVDDKRVAINLNTKKDFELLGAT